MTHEHFAVYGYRFLDTLESSFYQLFALGREHIQTHAYNWDGMKRIDGPLYLFQYTVSGQGAVCIEGQTYDLKPRTAFMVEIPGEHRYFLPETSSEWEFYFILFRQKNLSEQWAELVTRLGHTPCIPEDSGAIGLLKDMFHASANHRITDGYIASSLVYRFVMELFRFSETRRKEKASWPLPVQRAVQQLETSYCELQSLNELASNAGLSKYHFTRVFRDATGLTPISYLTKIRIERSVELLRSTSLSMEEIAREIGYSSGSYFIKVFRKWVGYPPGEVRDGREIVGFHHLKFD
ncbi:AraC family transcriptional regulator [Paenibacillus lemnae]|uniref:AraC family transcriptional regulator n=1 Tax=Paenibacillus lemnae TaxID=1330551 RepID=A0A848M096_PAELE|nr:AraC family transcriptional regulator [Paenibacillus lemnae]NMO94318.1 AraC family transcriptional regulator [Paenibacillus lemnae]